MGRRVLRLEDLTAAERRSVSAGLGLYREFTGREASRLYSVPIPSWPKWTVAIGQVDGLLYTAERDGKVERYVHEFKSRARPSLMVAPDGKPPLLLVGGAYDFTERGIVDD